MLCGNFKRKLDKQGRVIIPRQLRSVFGKGAVVVAGCGDHIEIWTTQQWAIETPKMARALDKIR